VLGRVAGLHAVAGGLAVLELNLFLLKMEDL
jgi:hypothetical protein